MINFFNANKEEVVIHVSTISQNDLLSRKYDLKKVTLRGKIKIDKTFIKLKYPVSFSENDNILIFDYTGGKAYMSYLNEVKKDEDDVDIIITGILRYDLTMNVAAYCMRLEHPSQIKFVTK